MKKTNSAKQHDNVESILPEKTTIKASSFEQSDNVEDTLPEETVTEAARPRSRPTPQTGRAEML